MIFFTVKTFSNQQFETSVKSISEMSLLAHALQTSESVESFTVKNMLGDSFTNSAIITTALETYPKFTSDTGG